MSKINPMRYTTIGIDAREFVAGDFTGIGRYLHNFLSHALTERPDYQFMLYGNQFTHVPLQGKNVFCKTIPQWNTLWWDNVTLRRIIKRDSIMLFFSPLDKIPLFLHCPSILTIHDLLFLNITHLTGFRRRLYEYLYLLSRSIMLKTADLVITVSNHSRDDIIKVFDVHPEKIKVVYSGVSRHYRPIINSEIIEKVKNKYGIKDRYILYVGNFKPHKNVLTLVKAYQELILQHNITERLVLAGKKSPDYIPIHRFVTGNRLEERVLFTDYVLEDDLPFIYSGAEIFVFPSLYEGFGLPPLEAMACNTPVIVSDRTSLPEIVGDAGIQIDASSINNLFEAMYVLLSEKEINMQFRKKGLERAKKFTVEKHSQGILDAIEGVLRREQ